MALTIEYSGGNFKLPPSFRLEVFRTVRIAARLSRAPGSDVWVLEGDGLAEPRPLTIVGSVQQADPAALASWLDSLESAIQNAVRVVDARPGVTRRRELIAGGGLEAEEDKGLPYRARVKITLYPVGPDWITVYGGTDPYVDTAKVGGAQAA